MVHRYTLPKTRTGVREKVYRPVPPPGTPFDGWKADTLKKAEKRYQ